MLPIKKKPQLTEPELVYTTKLNNYNTKMYSIIRNFQQRSHPLNTVALRSPNDVVALKVCPS